MRSQRAISVLISLTAIPCIAGGLWAQSIPDPGNLLISAIDSSTGLPDVFSITTAGLVGETGYLPNELATTVELAPVTPITNEGMEVVVIDNGSGMLRFTYSGGGSNEGGPVYASLIDITRGFDSFDNPIVGFESPGVAFNHPNIAFNPGMLGLQHPMRSNMPDFFEDPLFGFEDPLFGFEDPLFGFEDPLFGFTTNSAIVSYPTLDTEIELNAAGGSIEAGLAYPRAYFMDPNELNQFDGIDGESYRNYAGFAVYSSDASSGAGIYLAPLDRASIQSRTLQLQPYAIGGVFNNAFQIDGMHVDPVIPGMVYVWGSDGASRGGVPMPVVYRVNPDQTVSELTRSGNIESIDDLVVSLDGKLYILDATTSSGKIISVDAQSGTQAVLATGGTTFESPTSLSVVQQRSKVVEVNTTADLADPNPGDGDYFNPGFLLTLRAIIEEANAQAANHTIVLPSGTYDISSLGEISIQSNITIIGAGAADTILTGANASRVFRIDPSGSLKLRDLTIQDGRATVGDGACVLAQGPLAIEGVVIRSGNASNHGGGISSTSTLHAYKSHFTGNQSNKDGGAIHINGGSSYINRSSFFGNEALNGGAVSITNAAVDITNSTFAQNETFWEGGAVRTQSNQPVRFLHCTLVQNEAGLIPDDQSSGGIDSTGSTVLPWIRSCAFADNGFDGELADVTGDFEIADHSYFATLSGANFNTINNVEVGASPLLPSVPTQFGVTYAYSPLPSSPLIDSAASDEFPVFDQLGFNRASDGNSDGIQVPDIGASEAEAACPADMSLDGVLNYLDVSAFLSAFGSQDPAADFETDGMFNFLDVSAFLIQYGMGCP